MKDSLALFNLTGSLTVIACFAPPFATPGVYHLYQYTGVYLHIRENIQRRPPVASPMADSFVHIARSAGISSPISSGAERVLREDQSYQCNDNHVIIEANVRLA